MGLIGLVSIAALLAVYLLRPQFKNKIVSGTVVWKRVLLHEKNRRPTFDHVILFILQSLVLAAFAVGLAQPRLYTDKTLLNDAEYVLILDVSASMRAKSLTDGVTRFQRAVNEAKKEVDSLFSKADGGTVSLIVADGDPSYMFSGLKKADRDEIFGALDGLECTLGEGGLEEAVRLAGARLDQNPYANILLFTDTRFGNLGTAVRVVDVSDESCEQNVAVLGCTVGMRDNSYIFEVTLGAYGDVAMRRNVCIDIRGADNGRGPRDLHLEAPVTFSSEGASGGQTVRLSVSATDEAFGGQADWFFETYEEAVISVPGLNDSIPDDDSYYVYGGIRDKIKTEYWSKASKIFWQYGFKNLANNMAQTRDMYFREIYPDQGMQAQGSGYDFYIFEHSIPDEILQGGLPKDGVTVIVDPDQTLASAGLGLAVEQTVSLGSLTGCTGTGHPITAYMDPSRIGLTQYKKLAISGDGLFQTALSVGGDPVMLVKNTPSSKVVVLPFSLNMSNFYGEQFQIFLYNLLDYFMPRTLLKADFTVGETARLNCKGEELFVSGGGQTKTYTQFPAEFTFDGTGTYIFTSAFGTERADEVRRAYVHAPVAESELFASSDFRIVLDNGELTAQTGEDIFVWLAAAALVLMAVEWCIQFRYII